MKKATINLYDFNELNPKAKERAINDHRDFLLSVMQPDDFISGEPEYDTEEKLMETYNAEYEYFLNDDEPIIESIEINDYMFFGNGEMANVTTYTGGPKTGTVELKFCGEVYKL